MLERHHRKNAGTPMWLVRSALGATFLLATVGPGSLTQEVRGACADVCGDVNGSATVTSADIIFLIEYLFEEGPAPFDADCGDIDDYDLTTVRDLQWMINFVFKGGLGGDCALAFPPLTPTPSADFTIFYDPAFPAGVALHTVSIELDNTSPVFDLTLPIAITVDGIPAGIGAVAWGGTFDGGGLTVAPLGSPANTIVGGFLQLTDAVPPGRHVLATVDLLMVPAGCPRTIRLTYNNLPPLQGGVPVNYPMLLDPDLDAWLPELCPDAKPGDVDGDGDADAGDVITLVNYVFKAMCAPVPVAGDVNCTNTLTSADIIVLVGHVFKGGTLCDLCG